MTNQIAIVCVFISFFTFSNFAFDNIQVDRPRGVSLTKKIFYDPTKEFTCLDGSRTISYQFVNDDYCDCPDGTDEPGTSACPNGRYHCTNAGFRPLYIPSSRVNDKICDCCDGSDEWKNRSLCPNTCKELWKIEKEELLKQADEANQGVAIREQYSETGKLKRVERETALQDYQTQMETLQQTEEELKAIKDELEAKENEAKEIARKIMEEKQAEKAVEENRQKGEQAFAEMDADKDGSLSANELIEHTELDPNSDDSTFTEEEAQGILQSDTVDLSVFMNSVWPSINGSFQTALLPPVEEQEEPVGEDEVRDSEEAALREEELGKQEILEEEENGDQDDEYYEDDEEYGEEEEEEEDEHFNRQEEFEKSLSKGKETSSDITESMYYDDATRTLIAEADEARKKFQTNQDEKKTIEREVESLKKSLEMDLGTDEAFQALQFKCFELETLEYKYKLCPFDKTSQSPKNGGSETSLGRWGKWSGPEGFRYSRMKYENGLGCWNGPSRSTDVKIRCGMENKLLSVDEPSRCAYVFEFSTPCACVRTPEGQDFIPRDEL